MLLLCSPGCFLFCWFPGVSCGHEPSPSWIQGSCNGKNSKDTSLDEKETMCRQCVIWWRLLEIINKHGYEAEGERKWGGGECPEHLSRVKGNRSHWHSGNPKMGQRRRVGKNRMVLGQPRCIFHRFCAILSPVHLGPN